MADVTITRDTSTAIETYERFPRHKSAANAKDINQFVIYVHEAFQDYQRRFDISPLVPVKSMSPKEFIESPDSNADVILYRLVSRQRMNTASGGDIRRPWIAQLREEVQSSEDPNEIIRISGLKRENIVEFQVWSKYTRNANDIAARFETFIEAYTWFFTDMGFNRVIFQERLEDEVRTLGASEFYLRTLRYSVITEILFQEVSQKLREIIIQYDVGPRINTEILDEELGHKRYTIPHSND